VKRHWASQILLEFVVCSKCAMWLRIKLNYIYYVFSSAFLVLVMMIVGVCLCIVYASVWCMRVSVCVFATNVRNHSMTVKSITCTGTLYTVENIIMQTNPFIFCLFFSILIGLILPPHVISRGILNFPLSKFSLFKSYLFF